MTWKISGRVRIGNFFCKLHLLSNLSTETDKLLKSLKFFILDKDYEKQHRRIQSYTVEFAKLSMQEALMNMMSLHTLMHFFRSVI